MPEHLRALVVILMIAASTFLVAQAPLSAMACRKHDYERRRNLWFAVTLLAFLTHNFWIYVFATALVLAASLRSEPNRLALFFMLVLAVPRITATIPGLGVLNSLFDVDHQRLLVFVLLLPTAASLVRRSSTVPFGRFATDKLLLAYLLLEIVLTLGARTATSVLRDGVFNAFTDIVLPYYVASRGLASLQAFRDAMTAFLVSAIVQGVILLFEGMRGWLLYGSLDEALGAPWGWGSYLLRGGTLRGQGTMGQAIPAGCVLAVAFGFYHYIVRFLPTPPTKLLGALGLVAGLAGALSRAPWVGAAGMTVVFLALGPAPVWKMVRLGLVGLALTPLLFTTAMGRRFLDHLPWVGTVDAGTVEGREHLATVAYDVFLSNPILGRFDYINDPRMEAARGSDGLIDMVNTYICVALGSGLVGLGLYVAALVSAVLAVRRALRTVADRDSEQHVLGRALLATLVGLMFLIGTVSPVLIMPLLLWSLVGLCVGCAHLIGSGGARSEVARSADPPRSTGALLVPRRPHPQGALHT